MGIPVWAVAQMPRTKPWDTEYRPIETTRHQGWNYGIRPRVNEDGLANTSDQVIGASCVLTRSKTYSVGAVNSESIEKLFKATTIFRLNPSPELTRYGQLRFGYAIILRLLIPRGVI